MALIDDVFARMAERRAKNRAEAADLRKAADAKAEEASKLVAGELDRAKKQEPKHEPARRPDQSGDDGGSL